MNPYLIDHHNKIIHKTRFITDQCNHKHILHEDKQFTSIDQECASYVQQGYTFCTYCNR